MKFSVTKEAFVSGLSAVSKAVDNKVSISVLRNMLIRRKGENILLYGADGSLGICHKLDAVIPMGDPDEDCIIDCKMLSEFVKRTDGMIEFETKDGQAYIKSGKNKTRLSISSDEYPALDQLDSSAEIKTFTMKCQDFISLIERVAFSLGTDNNRVALLGINLVISGGKLSATTCDGYRFSHAETPIDAPDMNMLINGKSVTSILKQMANCEDMIVRTDGKRVMFGFGSTKVIACLIDKEYPNWRGIVPTTNKSETVLAIEDFYDAVDNGDYISSHSSRSNLPLCIKSNDNIVTFDCEDDIASAHNEIENVSVTGDEIDVGLNPKYVLEVLKAIKSVSSIKVAFNGTTGPVTINPVDTDDIYLVLPIRK